MRIEIHRITPDRQDDFYRVHDAGRGTGWCYCVAWWVSTWEGWPDRSDGENRALRERLFRDGHHDGYLLYVDGEPAGWCQCGTRDRLEKLVRQYGLPPDGSVYAITCFVLLPAFRGRGLAHRLMAGVLLDLQARGVDHVQGFPRRRAGLTAGEVWTGPETVFRRAGFALERDDPERPVYGWRPVAQNPRG